MSASINVVKLIGFLVANICRDEQEWKEWAIPFLDMLLKAQDYSHEKKNTTLKTINDMFYTLLDSNSKLKLVCEEEDGFINVHVGNIWWAEACAEDRLEEDLSLFLNNYIARASSSGFYDSRARVIARRVFSMLQSHEKFVELENKIFTSVEESKHQSTSGSYDNSTTLLPLATEHRTPIDSIERMRTLKRTLIMTWMMTTKMLY